MNITHVTCPECNGSGKPCSPMDLTGPPGMQGPGCGETGLVPACARCHKRVVKENLNQQWIHLWPSDQEDCRMFTAKKEAASYVDDPYCKRGEPHDPTAITRQDTGVSLPTSLLRNFSAMHDPRVHRTRDENSKYSPQRWDEMVDDVREKGVQEPITIAVNDSTTKYPKVEVIDGTHRLGWDEQGGVERVPVDLRYFGDAIHHDPFDGFTKDAGLEDDHQPEHEYVGNLGGIDYNVAKCKCGWSSNVRSEQAAKNAWQRHFDKLDEGGRQEKAGEPSPIAFDPNWPIPKRHAGYKACSRCKGTGTCPQPCGHHYGQPCDGMCLPCRGTGLQEYGGNLWCTKHNDSYHHTVPGARPTCFKGTPNDPCVWGKEATVANGPRDGDYVINDDWDYRKDEDIAWEYGAKRGKGFVLPSYGDCSPCAGTGSFPCESCGGTGHEGSDKEKAYLCEECGGDGRESGDIRRPNDKPCDYCKGSGLTLDPPSCEVCGGVGEEPCGSCMGDGVREHSPEEAHGEIEQDKQFKDPYTLSDVWHHTGPGRYERCKHGPQMAGQGLLPRPVGHFADDPDHDPDEEHEPYEPDEGDYIIDDDKVRDDGNNISESDRYDRNGRGPLAFQYDGGRMRGFEADAFKSCPKCKGDAFVKGSEYKSCGDCEGTGKGYDPYHPDHDQTPCARCQGAGIELKEKECDECKGEGDVGTNQDDIHAQIKEHQEKSGYFPSIWHGTNLDYNPNLTLCDHWKEKQSKVAHGENEHEWSEHLDYTDANSYEGKAKHWGENNMEGNHYHVHQDENGGYDPEPGDYFIDTDKVDDDGNDSARDRLGGGRSHASELVWQKDLRHSFEPNDLKNCDKCEGSGEGPADEWHLCTRCDGSGAASGYGEKSLCESCKGSGIDSEASGCSKCDGEGSVASDLDDIHHQVWEDQHAKGEYSTIWHYKSYGANEDIKPCGVGPNKSCNDDYKDWEKDFHKDRPEGTCFACKGSGLSKTHDPGKLDFGEDRFKQCSNCGGDGAACTSCGYKVSDDLKKAVAGATFERPPEKCLDCGKRHGERAYCEAKDDGSLIDEFPSCVACGEPSDYCQGGGPDSEHQRIIDKHYDSDVHDECDPDACDEAGKWEYRMCGGCDGGKNPPLHGKCTYCGDSGLQYVRSVTSKTSSMDWHLEWEKCWACGGSGKLRDEWATGYELGDDICPTCNGAGLYSNNTFTKTPPPKCQNCGNHHDSSAACSKQGAWLDQVSAPYQQDAVVDPKEDIDPVMPPIYEGYEDPEDWRNPHVKPVDIFSVPKTGGRDYGKCELCEGGVCNDTHDLDKPGDPDWWKATAGPIRIECQGKCHFCRGSGVLYQQDVEALSKMRITKVGSSPIPMMQDEYRTVKDNMDTDTKYDRQLRKRYRQLRMDQMEDASEDYQVDDSGDPVDEDDLMKKSNLDQTDWKVIRYEDGNQGRDQRSQAQEAQVQAWTGADQGARQTHASRGSENDGDSEVTFPSPEDLVGVNQGHVEASGEPHHVDNPEVAGWAIDMAQKHWERTGDFPATLAHLSHRLAAGQMWQNIGDQQIFAEGHLLPHGEDPEFAKILISDRDPGATPGKVIDRLTNLFRERDKARTAQVQRHCVICKDVFSESEHGEATGFCPKCREKEGLVTHHSWSEDAQEGHYGSAQPRYVECLSCSPRERDPDCGRCRGSGIEIECSQCGQPLYQEADRLEHLVEPNDCPFSGKTNQGQHSPASQISS